MMRLDRAQLLAELLREMRETCGDFIPDEAWYEVHRCFAMPYVEVVVPWNEDGDWKVFLMRRDEDDPHWPGRPWHIPGGVWRVSHSREEACRAIALREMSISLDSVREVLSYKWSDHAYANPISHVCICRTSSVPSESENARFVSIERLPENMLIHHREFVEACVPLLAE